MKDEQIRELAEEYLRSGAKPEVMIRQWGEVHRSHSGITFVECTLRIPAGELERIEGSVNSPLD